MLNKLSLKYNSKYLFKDVCLNVKSGSWISILGQSGVGKSTIIRIIAGLKTFGEISGTVLNQQTIAWMGQTDLLYPWLNVLNNVLLPISLKNQKPTSAEVARAKQLLDKVGLNNKYNYFPQQLSGGQRQRVALVRTLMQDGDLILMDEPFSALDSMTKRDCQNLFYQMLAGKTVIMVTHDVTEATRLSDEVYLMTGQAPYLKKSCNLKTTAPRPFEQSDVINASKKIWAELEKSYG